MKRTKCGKRKKRKKITHTDKRKKKHTPHTHGPVMDFSY